MIKTFQIIDDCKSSQKTNSWQGTMLSLSDEISPGCAPYLIAGSAAFFTAICNLLGSPYEENEDKKKTFSNQKWKMRNIQVSCIHSFLVSTFTMIDLYRYGHEYIRRPVETMYYRHLSLYIVVCFCAGYFMHDAIDYMRHAPKQRGILFHHVSVTMVLLYNALNGITLPIIAIAMSAEVNSIFLHLRKILQLFKWNHSHPVYRAIVAVNFITFFPFRFGMLATSFYTFMFTYKYMTTFHFYLICMGHIALLAIYIVALMRLVKNDILRNEKAKDF